MSPENKLRVVIDTNVLFSAVALPKDSPPTKVLELARSGRIDVFVSPFILKELERNLSTKAFWDESRIVSLKKKFGLFMILVEPAVRVDAIRSSEDDNRILECAVQARADVLVTGNMKDIRPLGRFKEIEIMTPREFLNKFFSNI